MARKEEENGQITRKHIMTKSFLKRDWKAIFIMGTRKRERGKGKKSKIERTIMESKKEENLKFRIESRSTTRIACERTHGVQPMRAILSLSSGTLLEDEDKFSSSRRYQWFPFHGSRSRWSLRSRAFTGPCSRIIKPLHNTSLELLSRLFSAGSV